MHRFSRPLTLLTIALALVAGACMPPEELLDEEVGESLYDRPEEAELEGDRERAMGDPATVHNLETTVLSGEFEQQLSETETAGYLVAQVRLMNPTRRTIEYNRLDWVLEFPDGSTKNRIAAASRSDQIDSGEIKQDETVEGKVYFQIGQTRGTFYVLHAPRRAAQEPEAEKERGVWEVTIE